MFLSKLTLNPRCRDARRDMASPYELHRTLARAFDTEPGTDYRTRHGVLFRLEPLAYAQALPTVLVQSVTEPDWAALRWRELPETYLLNDPGCKAWEPVLAVGQTLSFRLVANPTKKEKREGHKQGRRVWLPDQANDGETTPARAWLARKADQHGFRLLYATSDEFWLGGTPLGGNPLSHSRPDHSAKHRLPHYGVRFDGLLQVTDPTLLSDALRQGIGPAKAFGFGLLSLARPL